MSRTADVYVRDGVTHFRASALGACIRGLVAARLGIRPQPPAKFLQEALDDSSLAEEYVMTLLAKRGWKIESQQDEVFVDYDEGRIIGHIEGYIAAEKLERSVLEIKAFGPTLFAKYVKGGLKALGPPFTQMYEMQLSSYMYATQLPALLVVHGKKDQLILERYIDEPPVSEEKLQERMQRINECASKQEYPECDAKCNSKSWYWFIHEEPERNLVLDDEELYRRVRRAARLKKLKDRIDDEYKTLSDELKNEFGSGPHQVGDQKFNIAKFPRTLIDMDRLRRDLGDDTMAAYEYEVEQVRLTFPKKKR